MKNILLLLMIFQGFCYCSMQKTESIASIGSIKKVNSGSSVHSGSSQKSITNTKLLSPITATSPTSTVSKHGISPSSDFSSSPSPYKSLDQQFDLEVFNNIANPSITNEYIIHNLKTLDPKVVSNTPAQLPITQWAIVHNRSFLLPELIKHGADISAKDRTGNNSLHQALLHRDFDSIKFLIIHYPKLIHMLNDAQENAVHIASRKNIVGFIKAMVEHGADLNAQNKWGETPLYIAVNYDHLYMIQSLLKFGADPLIPTNFGLTPLSLAQYRAAQKDDENHEVAQKILDTINTFLEHKKTTK